MLCRSFYRLPVAPAPLAPSHFVPSQSFEDGTLKPGAGNSGGNSHFHPTKSLAPMADSPSQQEELAIKGTTITQPSPQKSCKIFSADAGLRHHDGCVDNAPAAST